jgi:hypothetical protein
VATEKKDLFQMLDCMTGEVRSLLDNQDYLAPLQRVKRIWQGWNIKPLRASARRMIEILIQTGGNEEKIEKLEKDSSEGVITEIESVYLAEELIITKLEEYSREEEAKAAHKKMVGTFDQVKGSMKDARKQVQDQQENMSQKEQRMTRAAMGFAGNLLNNNKITCEDTVLTTEITFSKKQLNTLGMLLSFAESMEKKQEEKEKARQ